MVSTQGHGGIGDAHPQSTDDTSNSVADLLFLIGPSPSENEYQSIISTNSILPSGCGWPFSLDRLLSGSLCRGDEFEGGNKAKPVVIGRGWES